MSDSAGPFGDVEATIARVEAQVAQAHALAERAEQVRVDIDGLRERVRSPQGELAVTVDATGRLIDLELTRSATGLGPESLARLVVETAARAQRAAGQRAVELAAEALGAESPAVAHLRGELDARLPERSDDEPKGASGWPR